MGGVVEWGTNVPSLGKSEHTTLLKYILYVLSIAVKVGLRQHNSPTSGNAWSALPEVNPDPCRLRAHGFPGRGGSLEGVSVPWKSDWTHSSLGSKSPLWHLPAGALTSLSLGTEITALRESDCWEPFWVCREERALSSFYQVHNSKKIQQKVE